MEFEQEIICQDCDDEVQQKWKAYKPEEYVILEGIINFSEFADTNSNERHTKLLEFIYAKTSVNMLNINGYEKGLLFRKHFEVIDEVTCNIFKTCICSQFNEHDNTLHSYVLRCIKNNIRFRVGCVCFKNLIGLQPKEKDTMTYEEHKNWVAKNQKSKICLICKKIIKRNHNTRPGLCSKICKDEHDKQEKQRISDEVKKTLTEKKKET